MYYRVEEKMKCSSCGAINHYETVTTNGIGGTKTIIRCLSCKHEKLQSTLTTSGPLNPLDKPKQISYQRKDNSETTF